METTIIENKTIESTILQDAGKKKRGRAMISAVQLEDAAIILFFAQPFFEWALKLVISSYANYISMLMPYALLALVIALHRGKGFPLDFLALLVCVMAFFGLTILIHPDYAFWYERDYYGVWDYVIRPDNGVYAYLFLRLKKDPDRLLKCLKISAALAYLYYAYRLYNAVRVGYWLSSWNGELRKSSYNLEFGYDLLLYTLPFLYAALKHKKMVDWVMAGIGLFMIVSGGSRGPILDVGIFLIVFALVEIENSRNKWLSIATLVIVIIVLYFVYVPILDLFVRVLDRLGISSRFLRMFQEGTVLDDNGRVVIWQHTLEMIKANPFGYGAMGSRHEIYYIIHVGHPHNIVLEILIDYGVFIGAAIIVAGIIALFRILRMDGVDGWKGLTMIFIGVSSQLLLSGTYWHRPAVWALLSIIVSVGQAKKRERSRNHG